MNEDAIRPGLEGAYSVVVADEWLLMLKPWEEIMRKTILTLALAAVLTASGCAGMTIPNPPVISDISDSMVRVRNTKETIFREWASPSDIWSEAQRGCVRYGKSAQFVSSWCILYNGECEVKEHLFTCN